MSRRIVHISSFARVFAVAGALVALPLPAATAAILSVDINSIRDNQPVNPSPNASGFSAFDATNNPGAEQVSQSAVIAPHTVTITAIGGAQLQARDREGVNGADFPDTPPGDLLRDSIQADGGTPGAAGMNLMVTGLAASTDHFLTVWLHDVFNNDDGDGVSIVDVNDSNAVIGSGDWPDSPAAAEDFSVSRFIVTAQTDAAGTLSVDLLHIGNGPGGAFINGALPLSGFEIDAVPEPAAVGLLATGAMFLGGRRRRQQI